MFFDIIHRSESGSENQEEEEQAEDNQEEEQESSEDESEEEGQVAKGRSKSLERRFTETEDGRFSCRLCEKIVSAKSKRLHVQRKHTPNLTFPCPSPVCTKQYRSRAAVKAHHEVHHGHRSFRCQTCDKKFLSERGCKFHIRRFHNA